MTNQSAGGDAPPAESKRSQHDYNKRSVQELKKIANGQWFRIHQSAGVPASCLTGKHGPCPICGGKDRFRHDDKNGDGTYFCGGRCGSGDGLKLLQLYSGKTFAETLSWLSDLLIGSQPVVSVKGQASTLVNEHSRTALNDVWNESQDVQDGDPVHLYLTRTRRLVLPRIPSALRLHRSLPYFEGKTVIGEYSAMLATVSAADGKPVSIHRTFLTLDGLKAKVSAPKRIMKPVIAGACSGGAIRLYEPSDVLGVAEGIETALACHVATGIPMWAAISSTLMEKLIVPTSVNEVVIFADNDTNQVGQNAAKKLAQRLHSDGKTVKILTPATPGTDWADAVTQEL
ncbi:MAG: toprim domain-containing protein [Cyanobacteria bacterium SZAS-4]|nr:toprim domain-containing protein [Cyanobacteria bacterium SZAS-4]